MDPRAWDSTYIGFLCAADHQSLRKRRRRHVVLLPVNGRTMEGTNQPNTDRHIIFRHPEIPAVSRLSPDDPRPRADCSGMSRWRNRGARPWANSPCLRARTSVFLYAPHLSDSHHGNSGRLTVSSTRLLALAGRVHTPNSSSRLRPWITIRLPDLVHCLVDSLSPLQVVYGLQEPASRLGVVELSVNLGRTPGRNRSLQCYHEESITLEKIFRRPIG